MTPKNSSSILTPSCNQRLSSVKPEPKRYIDFVNNTILVQRNVMHVKDTEMLKSLCVW